jgi:hypothetical protein
LDHDPELYEAVRAKAAEMNLSISAYVANSLRASLGWQVPVDSKQILTYVQQLDSSSQQQKDRLETLESESKEQWDKIKAELLSLQAFLREKNQRGSQG